MKAFIIGYYGCDNIGDEVLLHQVIKMIRDIDESISITSISYRTNETKLLHNIDSISRNKYYQIVKTIKNSDIVIGGGGSILQNITSNKSLIYYLVLFLISKIYGKKVIILGNGFGPVNGKFFRWLSKIIINKIDVFVARDSETVDDLEKIGVRTKVELAADLAYYEYESVANRKNRKVIINIRPWNNSQKIIDEMSKFIKILIDDNYIVEFLSMQNGKDDFLVKSIEKKLGISIPILPNSIDEFLSNKGDYCCMIGMRLHALVWAGIKDVPFIGIEYDPKINSYINMTNQMSTGSVENIDAQHLYKVFNKLIDEHDIRKEMLKNSNRNIKEMADINYFVLKNLMGVNK